MFVSHETNSNRKTFQKPNILRRKTKAPERQSDSPNDSRPDATSTSLRGTIVSDLQIQNISKFACVKPFQSVHKESVQKLSFGNNVLYGQIEKIDSKLGSQNIDNQSGLLVNIVNCNGENPVPSSVNVESFFNNGENRENVMLLTIDPNKEMKSLVIIDDESHKNALCHSQSSNDLITSMVPLSAVTTCSAKTQVKPQAPAATVVPPQMIIEHLTFGPITFKCDVPDCKKEFRSEQKWKRHKNVHNKDGSIRMPRQVTVECPVKKVNSDGTEQRCGKIYLVREQLVKHLNEDHTLEDAAYKCEQCGRQFFWATGLRAHARAHEYRARAPPALACGWPGCGRVFAQPCRLREHARAHTGDKPYTCSFPNCNSSFRSASKLERHARRHTGLRRHACGTCGRAFLRREHLRDHAARHHAAPRRLACVLQQCSQTFEDATALADHINSAHAVAETEQSAAPAAVGDGDGTDSLLKNNLDYIFLEVEGVEESSEATQQSEAKGECEVDNVVQEAATDGVAGSLAALESRAARTHCPWPLEPRYEPAHGHYVLEEDAVVDQTEGSESNIYNTVRSDLFLHGNVLINEDSVQMGTAVETGEAAAEASAPNDELGLGLLEHPHMDLMQEEMMFTAWQ